MVSEESLTHNLSDFLIIMIIGLLLCACAIGLMVKRIANTDRNNKEILQIFSLLQIDEIRRIYEICDQYIDSIDNEEFSQPPSNAVQYLNPVKAAK